MVEAWIGGDRGKQMIAGVKELSFGFPEGAEPGGVAGTVDRLEPAVAPFERLAHRKFLPGRSRELATERIEPGKVPGSRLDELLGSTPEPDRFPRGFDLFGFFGLTPGNPWMIGLVNEDRHSGAGEFACESGVVAVVVGDDQDGDVAKSQSEGRQVVFQRLGHRIVAGPRVDQDRTGALQKVEVDRRRSRADRNRVFKTNRCVVDPFQHNERP